MPAPYSTDIRKKVINAIEIDKQSKPDIAKRFAVSCSFVHSLWRHYQETGKLEAKKVGGHIAPKVDSAGGLEIKVWLIKEPDLTLNDLCDRHAEHFGISMGKSSMDRALKRMNIRYKKSPYDPSKYCDRTKQLKIDYCEAIADIPTDKLIFLDEMGAGLNLSPLYGRAPSNQRVYDESPVARGQRISLVGAMTFSGMKTALNFEGIMTGLVFL